MCGIVGVINSTQKVESELLIKMRDTMVHRGPDDAGIYINGNIGLAHRRLSIIDLSENARQPISNEDGSLHLVFNGEIYNYLELTETLKSKGHRFKTTCDAEVLLHLYEEKAGQCLEGVNGMFAFAIWDEKQKTLFAARDRMGIKPFYFFHDGMKFIFASEIKAIIEDPSVPRIPNHQAIADYLMFLYSTGEKTFFKGIEKLPAGHSLIFKGSRLEIKPYWELEFNYRRGKTEQWFADELLAILDDAVRLHLRSDVPVGCHLSGGIDSSTITCLAAKHLDKLKTFTGKFSEGGFYDETPYAKIVADRTDSEYFETVPSGEDFDTIFKKMAWHMDEPAVGPGIFPQYYVCKLASENVKVVLGGQGGDELFGGYEKYRYVYERLADKYKTRGLNAGIALSEKLKSIARPILGKSSPHPGSDIKDLIPLWIYYNHFTRNDDPLISPIYGLIKEYSPDENFSRYMKIDNGAEPIDKILYHDQRSYLTALLHVEDRTSMSVSLESRVPLLDYRLVEFAATIPPEIKLKGFDPKHILKAAVKNVLPDEISARRDKRGFPTPLEKWLKGPQKGFFKDILLSDAARNRNLFDHNSAAQLLENPNGQSWKIWALLNVEYWHQIFIDKQ